MHRAAPTPDRGRRVWPLVTGLLLGLGAVAAAAGAVMALEATQVRASLEGAKAVVADIAASVKDGDMAAAQSMSAELTQTAADAAVTMDGPLWRLAARIPVVGVNVEAVQRATAAIDILVHDALPPGLEIAEAMDLGSFSLANGGVDLTPLLSAQSAVIRISDALDAAEAEITAVDRDGLLPVVGASLDLLFDVIDSAAPTVQLLSDHLPTILDVAGATGPRDYLIVFQNNAEIRATGGNPSTTIMVTVDNGHLALSAQGNSADYYYEGLAGRTFVDLPAETLSLYEPDFTRFSQNYSRTPQFATTAELFSALVERASGIAVDGVISIDPVVLSYMLGVTGPITLQDGSEVTSDNVVASVLFDAYERFGMDNTGSDAYFADVSSTFFSRLSAGGWDPLQMLSALQQAADEQRLYLWFREPSAEQLASDLGLDGSLETTNEETTEVGIFLNNASYSKLEFFMRDEVVISCDAAAGTMTTTLRITNEVPRSDLNGWTLAWRNGSLGLPVTSLVLDVLYFGPPDTSFLGSSPSTSDLRGWDRQGVDGGREAYSRTVVVPMGQSKAIAFTSTLPAAGAGPISVRYSPGVTETGVTVDESCAPIFG